MWLRFESHSTLSAVAISVNTPLEEPSIPEKLKWPLAALWISLGLHGALIAWVQIAPPPPGTSRGTIEARLVSVSQPLAVPQLAPDIETDEALAVAVPESVTNDDAEAGPTPAPPTSPIPPSPPQPLIPRLEIPVAVDLHYYPARELDQTPRGKIPEPTFPGALSGKIKFQVRIEESGRVSGVEVMASDPPETFDQTALALASEALRVTQFTPGIKNGRPVRALVIYELTINPGGAEDPARLPSGSP